MLFSSLKGALAYIFFYSVCWFEFYNIKMKSLAKLGVLFVLFGVIHSTFVTVKSIESGFWGDWSDSY